MEKYDAEVKLAVFDFENDDFDKLPADLKNIDVGILRKLGWKCKGCSGPTFERATALLY